MSVGVTGCDTRDAKKYFVTSRHNFPGDQNIVKFRFGQEYL